MRRMAVLVLVLAIWPSTFLGAEGTKNDCEINGGVCGCSQGRLICCDGSFVRDQSSAQAKKCASSTNYVQPTSRQTYTPTFLHPQPYPPSHETFWKRSVFDR